MGHCKHDWKNATDTLQAVFAASERRTHAFYVCARCLKIDEVLVAPTPLPLPQDETGPGWPEPKRNAA